MLRPLSERCVLFLACLIAVAACTTTAAQAQTFSVIHSFTNQGDGFAPTAGLTLGPGGKLYGTAASAPFRGIAFQLSETANGWIFNNLFAFDGQHGRQPYGGVVFGPGGALYGLASAGGSNACQGGCGVAYSLRPPQNPCRSISCRWTPTAIYTFNGPPSDAEFPNRAYPAFDSSGRLYGTSIEGGSVNMGTVFQLTRSGNSWTESIIQDFTGPNGAVPYNGVIVDESGNLYGTVSQGGPTGNGAVFELSPSAGGWTETILFDFHNRDVNGCVPIGGIIRDQARNLYGTTLYCGSTNNGTVFELSPSGAGWTYHVLASFPLGVVGGGGGSEASLVMDAAGNLYGTAYASGQFGYGSVFKLTNTNGSWTYTDLHDFRGGIDGANPEGGPILDASGNLYGTTVNGGVAGVYCTACGVVWKLAP